MLNPNGNVFYIILYELSKTVHLLEKICKKDKRVYGRLYRIDLKTYGELRLPIFNCDLCPHTSDFLKLF